MESEGGGDFGGFDGVDGGGGGVNNGFGAEAYGGGWAVADGSWGDVTGYTSVTESAYNNFVDSNDIVNVDGGVVAVNNITSVATSTGAIAFSNLNVSSTVGVTAYTGTTNTATNVEVELADGTTVTQNSFPSNGAVVRGAGSINTPVEYGDMGEDLSVEAQTLRETNTDDPVAFVTSMFQEVINDATNAKASIISQVVDTEIAFQSGTTNQRAVGPGIGGASTELDVVDTLSYSDLITSTAELVEAENPGVLAAIALGLPNPLAYGFDLETGIFVSEEAAEAYGQARIANIANIVSTAIGVNITGYQISQAFLSQNTNTFTTRNPDGSFQVSTFGLQSLVASLDDPAVAQTVVRAIEEAGGNISRANLNLDNLERIAEDNNIQGGNTLGGPIGESVKTDATVVGDTSGNPTLTSLVVSQGFTLTSALDTSTLTSSVVSQGIPLRTVDTSLSRAQSNAEPDSPESSAPVTQYQNYAAALEIIREETGGKTASEWVAEGKLTETTPGSGVFTGTVPIALGSSVSVPLTVTQATIDVQQALIDQTTQQRQGLLDQGVPASTLDNPVNLEKAVAVQLPLADQVLSTTSASAVSPDQASAGSGILVEPIPVQPIPQRQAQRVTSEQASAGSGSSISTTTLALVAAASAVAVTNSDAVVSSVTRAFAAVSSFAGSLFTSNDTTASASTFDTGDYGSDYTSEFALANSVGLDDITTSAGDVNGSDIYEWPTGADGSTPYDDDGNLNPGWELSENNDPVYVGFNKTDTPADVPVQDIYQYPSGPNGETPYDDDGNLNPGWGLDENNNPVYIGSTYIDQSLLDSAAASGEYAKKLLAQQQATLEAQRKLINNGDWRVRLSLASGADYLYNTPGNGSAGILEPLRVTNGVLFPYTPQIDTQYRAEYDSYSLTHSNYKGYFYKSSHIDAVNITATFTAQDTSEAEYLLAVIHFFRSVTKMFYGQDPQRGAPPPLVFLTGLGEYQFNGHPCVVTSFNYTLPADVNYIRARSKNVSYSNLLQRRDRQSLPTNILSSALDRLFNAGATKGAIPETQAPPTLGLNSPTYVPTKMQITISLLPVQSRSQVSKQFSVKQFANGNLLKGGFW